MTSRRQFLLGAAALAVAPSLPAAPVSLRGCPIQFDDETFTFVDLQAERMILVSEEFLRTYRGRLDEILRDMARVDD